MKYLRKYDESNVDYIIGELEDIGLELKDEGFDFKVEPWEGTINKTRTSVKFIIFYILPGENDKINDLVIDTSYRVIDFMYQNSYDLGSNKWVHDGEGKLRIKKINSDYYSTTKEELIGFKNIPFKHIQLVFEVAIFNRPI